MKTQYTLRAVLVVLAILCIVFSVWFGFSRAGRYRITKPVDPFPTLAQIESISAKNAFEGIPEFDVPKEHWNSIRNGLLPAEIDDLPSTWEILGRLRIVTKNEGDF